MLQFWTLEQIQVLSLIGTSMWGFNVIGQVVSEVIMFTTVATNEHRPSRPWHKVTWLSVRWAKNENINSTHTKIKLSIYVRTLHIAIQESLRKYMIPPSSVAQMHLADADHKHANSPKCFQMQMMWPLHLPDLNIKLEHQGLGESTVIIYLSSAATCHSQKAECQRCVQAW